MIAAASYAAFLMILGALWFAKGSLAIEDSEGVDISKVSPKEFQEASKKHLAFVDGLLGG